MQKLGYEKHMSSFLNGPKSGATLKDGRKVTDLKGRGHFNKACTDHSKLPEKVELSKKELAAMRRAKSKRDGISEGKMQTTYCQPLSVR